MAHAICTKRCYRENREFLPGEVLWVDGEGIPVHFRAADEKEITGKRVYHAAKKKAAPNPNAPQARAQRGDSVALSELL